MKKTFLMPIFLFGLLLGSCNNKPKYTTKTNNVKDTTNVVVRQEKENFYIFFDQFRRDSVFQNDRIIFPLIVLLLKTDVEEFNTELYDERMLNQKEWGFVDLSELPKNYLERITKLSDDEYNYNIQIDGTGVYVNYIFKIYNNKWFLVKIKDQSM